MPKNNPQLIVLILFFFGFRITSVTAQENASTESYAYRISYDNKIVGHIVHEEYRRQGLINTIETLKVKTQFKGMRPLINQIIKTHQETNDGKAKSFTKEIQIPHAERRYTARASNNQWIIEETRGDKSQKSRHKIPKDFLLYKGLQLKTNQMRGKNNTFFYSKWNDQLSQFEKTRITVGQYDQDKKSWLMTQTSLTSNTSNEYRVDDHFILTESDFDFLGKTLHIARCANLCKGDKLEALRPLDYQMLQSPYEITEIALKGKIRYHIKLHSSKTPPNTPEQQVRKIDTGWAIDVCANCIKKSVPTDDDLSNYLVASQWMEIQDPLLIQAVGKVIKPQHTATQKMNRLVTLTRHRLESHLQFNGYATALQAYKNRSGDCTEYALLLAAMGRIAKIPTRILFGFSYSRESFHGKKNMFAPHAWVQAWIDGQWKSFDAGLNGFDAGHIALKISNGDQQDFSQMFEYFSDFRIQSAQQIVKKNSSTKLP